MTGVTGAFYNQFALTITTATIISLLVSLTLSPAMGALLLKHKTAYADMSKVQQVIHWPGHKFN
jgi:multidrug efflux pump subunit AcrB